MYSRGPRPGHCPAPAPRPGWPAPRTKPRAACLAGSCRSPRRPCPPRRGGTSPTRAGNTPPRRRTPAGRPPDRIERRLPRLRVLLLHRVPHVRSMMTDTGAARDTARVSWGTVTDSPIDVVAARMRQRLDRVADRRRPPCDLPQHLPGHHGGGRPAGDGPGSFEIWKWVQRWDACFAQLYLDAHDADVAGDVDRVPRPWRLAFGAPAELPALRHVLLGINAHVNYDLPQAMLAVISPDDFADPVLIGPPPPRSRTHRRGAGRPGACRGRRAQRRSDADGPDARPAQPAQPRSGFCVRPG